MDIVRCVRKDLGQSDDLGSCDRSQKRAVPNQTGDATAKAVDMGCARRGEDINQAKGASQSRQVKPAGEDQRGAALLSGRYRL